MYADFKNRVCEGRGIDPEVIDLVAGGRVMTGLKAFELNAPDELIRQIKGLGVPVVGEKAGEGAKIEEVVEAPAVEGKEAVQQSPVEKHEQPAGVGAPEGETGKEQNKAAIVVIDEDQDTSPYAPPQTAPTTTPSTSSLQSFTAPIPIPSAPTAAEAPTKASDPAAHNAETALVTATPEELAPVETPSSPSAGSVPAAGRYQVKPGPFGRGLIDGIGGIRDAMVYACELFVGHRRCDCACTGS